MATSGPSHPGFDAFNRIVDLPWTRTSTGDIAHLKFGYDLVPFGPGRASADCRGLSRRRCENKEGAAATREILAILLRSG
ncbi:MAG TPA: hypothetical protein VFE24_04030 [Pirellulales bacterium]|jgi:hypothetical protein|nr:hypothetical protein [Pirellulales bacterium]